MVITARYMMGLTQVRQIFKCEVVRLVYILPTVIKILYKCQLF